MWPVYPPHDPKAEDPGSAEACMAAPFIQAILTPHSVLAHVVCTTSGQAEGTGSLQGPPRQGAGQHSTKLTFQPLKHTTHSPLPPQGLCTCCFLLVRPFINELSSPPSLRISAQALLFPGCHFCPHCVRCSCKTLSVGWTLNSGPLCITQAGAECPVAFGYCP